LKHIFEIKRDTLDDLKKYAQGNENEVCGILLCSKVGDICFRINKASPPFVLENSSYGCIRDVKKSNAYIETEFEQSNHTRIYCGEWHSHPEEFPRPSELDRQSIVSIFEEEEIAIPFVLMVIVGLNEIYYGVYDGDKFMEIFPIEVE